MGEAVHRIVVMGAGGVPDKAARALVSDLWDSVSGNKRVVIPVTGDRVGDVASAIADWCIEESAPFEVMGDDFEISDRVYSAACKVTEVQDSIRAAISSMSVTDHLVIAWDDSKECHRALRMAQEAGITAMDLTNGLLELELSSDEDESPMSSDEGEELPVTMPMRDDDAKTPIEVFLSAVSDVLASAEAEVIRLAGEFTEQMSPSVPGVVTDSPRTANTRSLRRQKERSGVVD